MTEYRSVLERAGSKAPRIDLQLERVRRRRDRRHRNQRIAAAVVGIGVFVAAIVLVTTSGTVDVDTTTVTPGGVATGPSVTGPSEPTVAPKAGGIVGLPLEGATPSAPEHGRLVLSVGGNVGGPWASAWVYADGRMISAYQGGYLPAGAPSQGGTGFVERHLTPEGVKFLHTQVLSTGLFGHDLRLLLDPPTGILEIEARSGGRLVRVTWAWERIAGKDAPPATPEQANALQRIHALFAYPTTWPARVWKNEEPKTYVPSRYQVFLRLMPDQGDGPSPPVGERELELLPAAAADILRHATILRHGNEEVRQAIYELTTGDVRALAAAFSSAGLEPTPIEEDALRYTLENTDRPGYSLWVFVGPVLPHGEAVFLGPG